MDEPASSTPPSAPSPNGSIPAPAPQQAPPPVSPAAHEVSTATAGPPTAPPELTPPGLTPVQQENFRRLYETCLSSVASQTAEEADAAIQRVLAAAHALASPQANCTDQARAEVRVVAEGIFHGVQIWPLQVCISIVVS